MIETDCLQRFIFENKPIRGEIVQLNHTYSEISKRHPYPAVVKNLLGETLAAVALLNATLKYEGQLILQINGTGSLKLLLAQANQKGHLRGLADWEGDIENASFSELMAGGKIVITINLHESRERYQGIVELKGESLAQALENYFAQSEQLPTFIFLASNEKKAAGLLLQVMPGTYDKDPGIAWEHLTFLSKTLKPEEILNLSNQKILKNLFHEEDVRVFDPEPISFVCQCNRERMESAILLMGEKDAMEDVTKNKVLTVTCEFCNRHLDFDEVDVRKIFASKSSR